MKKYKHKNTDIIVLHEEVGRYTILDWGIFTPMKGNVSLNFDFNNSDWEEVKEEIKISNLNVKEEPNYLITAFRSTKDKSLARINALGLYDFGIPLEDFLTGDNSIEDGKWEIYSVKNSKGEEFTIGDKINAITLKNATIESFAIINKSMVVYCDMKTNFLDIEWCSKVRTPIYTTTDGVDIKEGSHLVLYLVNKELNTLLQNVAVINNFSKQDAEVASRYLTFTSEENRDKYIKENTKKFLFTTKDGVKIYNGDIYYLCIGNIAEKHTADENLDWTEEYNGIRFYDKELAQEYIDNNKPKYSLADIEKCYFEGRSCIGFIEELKKLGK